MKKHLYVYTIFTILIFSFDSSLLSMESIQPPPDLFPEIDLKEIENSENESLHTSSDHKHQQYQCRPVTIQNMYAWYNSLSPQLQDCYNEISYRQMNLHIKVAIARENEIKKMKQKK